MLLAAPVSNVVVNGNNWLQHGDILNLSVSCNGSAPFTYCFQIHTGEYNVTGNETCINQQRISGTLPHHKFYYYYYFKRLYKENKNNVQLTLSKTVGFESKTVDEL